MSGALIECVHVASGARLQAGSKLFDVSVDLGGAFAHECPPISYYRLVLRETLWLRHLAVAPGMRWEMDDPLAILTLDPDEPLTGGAIRPARIAAAGIVYHDGMWSGGVR